MENVIENSMSELSGKELTGIGGGSFAYDAGRLLRFIALDFYHGYNNGLGWSVATLDFMMNSQ